MVGFAVKRLRPLGGESALDRAVQMRDWMRYNGRFNQVNFGC